MLNLDKTKLMTILNKLLVYALIIYVFVILGRSVWVNWALKTQSDQIKKDIEVTDDGNQALKNLILYYQSDSFKELEARQELGMKLPDEKAVAIPVKKYQDFRSEMQTQQETAAAGDNREISNWRAWWEYFFQG